MPRFSFPAFEPSDSGERDGVEQARAALEDERRKLEESLG